MSRSRSSSTLFRGSELPRLVILGAVALAGWPMVLLFAQAKDDPQPRAVPPLLAADLKPVVADSGIEFQALVDRAPMKTRENAAYAILLDRVRSTPARDLAARSRRDLYFTHFWERPELYRGVPVHVEGTALRILTYEVNPALAPSGRVYEAWVYPDDSQKLPYVLTFEAPPPDLVIGQNLYVRVRFDGYFLKLLSYRAGDTMRAAPLFVGRLGLMAQPTPPPAPIVELREMSKRHGLAILVAMLVGYVLIRVAIQARRVVASPRRSIPLPERSLTAHEITPEDLSDWLANLPDQTIDDPGIEPPAASPTLPRD